MSTVPRKKRQNRKIYNQSLGVYGRATHHTYGLLGVLQSVTQKRILAGGCISSAAMERMFLS